MDFTQPKIYPISFIIEKGESIEQMKVKVEHGLETLTFPVSRVESARWIQAILFAINRIDNTTFGYTMKKKKENIILACETGKSTEIRIVFVENGEENWVMNEINPRSGPILVVSPTGHVAKFIHESWEPSLVSAVRGVRKDWFMQTGEPMREDVTYVL